MKPKVSWSVILFAALLLTGGKPITSSRSKQVVQPSKQVARQNHLAESLKTWQKLKALHNGSYRYSVEGGFLTFYDVTTIMVRRGKVVSQIYSYFERNSKDQWVFMDEYSWTEEGAAVGSHEGAAPLTVDELYRVCRDEVLTRNPRVNDIYLDFKANGVLDSCVYGLKGFTTDVFPGVYVGTLEFLPTKPD